jgi:hypothetical protein
MYKNDLIEICKNYKDRKYITHLGVNIEKRSLIKNATLWLPDNVSIRTRCVMICNNVTQENFPKCNTCKSNVEYEVKRDYSFNQYCSVKCRSNRKNFMSVLIYS